SDLYGYTPGKPSRVNSSYTFKFAKLTLHKDHKRMKLNAVDAVSPAGSPPATDIRPHRHKETHMEKETLLEWYRQMVLIRRFEQRCAELYQLGKIGGFLHLYIGQEAIAVGAIAARNEGDHIITA